MCCKKFSNFQQSSWKIILSHYLRQVGGRLLLSRNFSVKKLPVTLPKFYVECLQTFSEHSASVREQILNLSNSSRSSTVIKGQSPDFSARRRRPNLHSNHRRSVSNNRQALLSYLVLRWLDWIFLGGYLPSLSINYVAMSKDMEKRFPQLYYIKMKNSFDLGFIPIGVAMAT